MNAIKKQGISRDLRSPSAIFCLVIIIITDIINLNIFSIIININNDTIIFYINIIVIVNKIINILVNIIINIIIIIITTTNIIKSS